MENGNKPINLIVGSDGFCTSFTHLDGNEAGATSFTFDSHGVSKSDYAFLCFTVIIYKTKNGNI